jgi:hypothetical protein
MNPHFHSMVISHSNVNVYQRVVHPEKKNMAFLQIPSRLPTGASRAIPSNRGKASGGDLGS